MVTISEDFRRNILEIYHEEGADWLDRLPDLIGQFEARWSIRVLEPFLLSFSYCAPAVRPDGTTVVFKLAVPSDDFRNQVKALRYYTTLVSAPGMVRLLDADIDRGAILMEHLQPGEMLADAVQDDDQATRIAAEVMGRVWVPIPPDHDFVSMANWSEDFKKIRVMFMDQACPLPVKTIERTERLFTELLGWPGPQFLLHGDLHHFNILSVQEENGMAWKAIDPFGVVGDREVEIGGFIRNPDLGLPLDTALQRLLNRRLDIFQEQLGFDRQRMAAWSSVYAAVSAWWNISAGAGGWQGDAALADYFAGLLD
jgi:streptomycin 6-kinase